ncbi:MAG: leucine-rich repeat protein [Ruminococcus flavefaciens]|nr:leucine-rich repeat protein [Ruminococcus flavefaciens]
MNVKKIFAVIVACCIVCRILPSVNMIKDNPMIIVAAADYILGTYENITYRNYDDYIEITGCDESATEIVIPEKINGIKVTKICDYAFYKYSNLISVIIPDSVISIGRHTFNKCSSLTTVTIPKGVTSIEDYTFNECSSLTSIIIPDSVTVIGEKAFSKCSSLTSITIPKGVTSIGDYAFYECYDLTSVTIPNSVIGIGNFAFEYCRRLPEVIIPDSVKSIGDYAFAYCSEWNLLTGYFSGLTSVTIPNSVTSIGANAFYNTLWLEERKKENPLVIVNGILIDGKFCSGNVVIPEDITSIAGSAFFDCERLISVTIPDSITSIGDSAFAYCKNLTSVTISDNIAEIGSRAFYATSWLKAKQKENPLVIVNGILIDGETCSGDIIIPDSVTNIGDYSFRYCEDLTSVTMSNGVKNIGNGAFWYCSGLKSIVIPNSVTRIETDAFANSGLREITILNPECEINYNFMDRGTIYGYENSTAQAYAKKYTYYEFKSIENVPEIVITEPIITSISTTTTTTNATTISEPTTTSIVSTTTGNSITTSKIDKVNKINIKLQGKISNNISNNDYNVYSSTVKSYLFENNGKITRLEYINDEIIIEDYSFDGELLFSYSLEMPLPIFGGFFHGSNANYIIVGQENLNEDRNTEVIRVLKYNKDWELIKTNSIYGSNTVVPFESGSLRMSEKNNKLFIHTSHIMYAALDGLNHQANMTFVIDEDDMRVLDSIYGVSSNEYGYVSHSFNQFISVDYDETVYRCDHGDAEPRAITISKCSNSDDITDVLTKNVLEIKGNHGNNDTGVSIGGFQLSENKCLVVGISVDMSAENYSSDGQRNIFLSVVDKNLKNSSCIYLTSYNEKDNISVRTPQMISISSDMFLIMWEEYNNSNSNVYVKAITVDENGNTIQPKTIFNNIRLSDCQPIMTSDDTVKWYVTDNSSVNLYQINPYNIIENSLDDVNTTNTSLTTTSTDTTISTTIATTTATTEKSTSGDVNSDGVVDLKDVILVRRYYAGNLDVSINKNAADVNDDNEINLKDVVLIRRIYADS